MLKIKQNGSVAHVILDRPDVRNAFNAELIQKLTVHVKKLSSDSQVRVIVFSGSGKCFCAGADLNYMQAQGQASADQNKRDAHELADLFKSIATSPKACIAKVHGAAFGGALGLIAACDVVIATSTTKFCFSEIKLGLLPATIAPFVFRKIGYSEARRLFLSGTVFIAPEALRVHLIHEVVSDEVELEARTEFWIQEFLKAAPLAISLAKELIDHIADSRDDLQNYTVEALAKRRASPEAQEGLAAFFEKRKPGWDKSQ